jgi:hypothetical protein
MSWSPQYQLIRAKLHAWNLLRKRAQGGKVYTRMLIRKLKEAELEDHLLNTLSEIEDARASIWREQKHLKQKANQLRVSWLQSLGEAKAELGLMSVAQAVKKIYRPTMDSPYPRCRSRKRCWPANMGSRQYPRPQHVTARRVRGLLSDSYHSYYYQLCWLRLC